jgi:hypothetical protein
MKTVRLGAVLSRLKQQYFVEAEEYEAAISVLQGLKDLKKAPLIKKLCIARSADYRIMLTDAQKPLLKVFDLSQVSLPEIGLALPGKGMQPFIVSEEDEQVEYEGKPVDSAVILAAMRQKGPYAHYEEDLPYINFPHNDRLYGIIYRGYRLDSNQYPVIPEACFDYCVKYLLREEYRKRFVTRQCSLGELQEVSNWCSRAARNTTVAPASVNKMNDIFDVLTSFDRKSFGTPL